MTSESNDMMYPLNDEKGEQMPVWLVDMLSNPLVNTLSDIAGGRVDNGAVNNFFCHFLRFKNKNSCIQETRG